MKLTHKNFIDLEGKTFGRLTVLEYAGVRWPEKKEVRDIFGE
jgi:preprotein translocase subunit SecE